MTGSAVNPNCASLLNCPECGYRVTGSTAGRCPECSFSWDPKAIIRQFHLNRFDHRIANRGMFPVLVTWLIVLPTYAAVIGFLIRGWSTLGLIVQIAALIFGPWIIGPLFPIQYPLRRVMLVSFDGEGIAVWDRDKGARRVLSWSEINAVRLERVGSRYAVRIACDVSGGRVGTGKPPIDFANIVIGATLGEASAIDRFAEEHIRASEPEA